jgi:long-chain acyl-CoA synthetase
VGLLAARRRQDPRATALAVKRRGIYEAVSWDEYAQQVAAVARGLRALGLERGDRIAILADPRPEWLYSELGALAAGCLFYGIYPTSAPDQIGLLLRHGGARVIIVEDQEQADKVLSLGDSIPGVLRILVIDQRGMFTERDPRVRPFAELLTISGDDLAALASRIGPDDPALIVYTSGTTGEPRGAVYTHAALVNGTSGYRDSLLGSARRRWRTVAYLPLNHAFEQFNTVVLPLVAQVTPHFGEDAGRVVQTVFEVAPDFFPSVPRYWQKFASSVLVATQESSPEKRLVYRTAMAVGRRYARARWERRMPPWLRAAYALADLAAFRPIREKVGLGRVRVAVTAGAPMPHEVQTLWQIWGVDLRNLYGQTEAGFVSVQPGPFPRPGDVGAPPQGVEVRCDADGEILIRSEGRCVGYWDDPAATAELFADGWLRTGDIGELMPDGSLRIFDRKKDILITAGGKNVSPVAVEDRLRASPYISEAVVIGEGRPYLVALIEIDGDAVAQWARARELRFGGFTDLATAAPVVELIAAEVQRASSALGRVERPKAFRIISRELDPELDGEPVTPTRKVKRRQMEERFRDLIEGMYTPAADVRIAHEVGRAAEEVTP